MSAYQYQKNLNYSVDVSESVKDRMHRYVNLAKALFRKGATSHGRTFNCCFAVRKTKIITIGINDYFRLMPKYSRKLKTNFKKHGERSYHPCVHAEMSALFKLGSDDCSDIAFFNVRLDKNCHCANSQPCSNCLRVLRMVNAKHIYCYDDDLRIVEVL